MINGITFVFFFVIVVVLGRKERMSFIRVTVPGMQIEKEKLERFLKNVTELFANQTCRVPFIWIREYCETREGENKLKGLLQQPRKDCFRSEKEKNIRKFTHRMLVFSGDRTTTEWWFRPARGLREKKTLSRTSWGYKLLRSRPIICLREVMLGVRDRLPLIRLYPPIGWAASPPSLEWLTEKSFSGIPITILQ